MILNAVLEEQKTKYIKELESDKFENCIIYWDSTQMPIFENEKMKYIFETTTEVTERVSKNLSIERQNKIIEQQKKELEIIVDNIYDDNGDFKLGVMSYRDVTKDFLYKQSIERQLDMLTKLINNLDLPVARLSYPELTIIDVNQKKYNVFKALNPEIKSINDIIGKCYSEFIFHTNDDYDILKYIREEVEKRRIPYIKQRKWNISGEEMFVTILYQPIVGDNQENTLFSNKIRNKSESIQVELSDVCL